MQHQLIVAALTLLCASSISSLNLIPSQTTLAASGSARGAPGSPPSAAPQHPAPDAALEVAVAPELRPAVATVLAHLEGRHTQLSRRDVIAVAETIVEQAERYQLDPSLVLAVIQVESGYYNLAVSHVGALGLMQLMPATGRELAHKHGIPWSSEESLFDPIVNIKLGTAYLAQLSNKYDGNVGVMLAAYNWGPGRIDRFLRRGTPVPTEYAQRVMQSYTPTRRASST